MSAIETLLSSPVVHRVGWGLVHFLWQGMAAAAVLAAVLWVLRGRSARARYLAAWAALLAMAAAVPVTAWLVPVPGPEAAPDAAPVQVQVAVRGEVEPQIEAAPIPGQAGRQAQTHVQVQSEWTGPSVDGPDAVQTVGALPGESAAAPRGRPAFRLGRAVQPALPWVFCAWLVGATGLSLWHLGGWARVGRLRRAGTRPAPPAVLATLDGLIERVGVSRPVRLLVSTLLEVPTVIGWLRPLILVPAAVLDELSPQQLETILAHELAHVRRRDFLWNLLQTVIETLLFYHPAVWWVSGRIRIEREACCDDLAVAVSGDRLLYARALARLAQTRHGPARRIAGLTVAADGGSLVGRIRHVLGLPADDSGRSQGWLGASLAVLAVIAALLGCMAWAGEGGEAGAQPRKEAAETTAGSKDTRQTEEADPLAQSLQQAAPRPAQTKSRQTREDAGAPAQKPDGNAAGEPAWSKPLGGLRVRVSAPAGSEHRRGKALPLLVELENVGEEAVPFRELMREGRMRVEDAVGNWLGIPRFGATISPWEAKEGGLAPGASMRWEVRFGRLRLAKPVPAGSSVRFRYSVPLQVEEPGKLPWTEYSVPVVLKLADVPGDSLAGEDVGEKWTPQMELAYREKPGLGGRPAMAVQVDGRGRVTVIEGPPPARTEATLPRARLDELAQRLHTMKVWELARVKREIAYPDEGELRLSLACGGATLVGTYPMHVVRRHPALGALQKEMRDLAAAAQKAAEERAPPTQSPQRPINVLLINGDPDKVARRSETFYVAAALAAAPEHFRVDQQTAIEPASKEFLRATVVVFCNVAEVSPEHARAMEAYVRRGGGLVFFMGDKVKPAAYNRELYRGGRGVLPAELGGTVALDHASLNGKPSPWPALAALATLPDAATRKAYRLRPPKDDAVRTVCRFSTAEPAIIQKRLGQGRCILFATTCDRDWTDLPLRPTYLLVVYEMVWHAAGFEGEPAKLPLRRQPFDNRGRPKLGTYQSGNGKYEFRRVSGKYVGALTYKGKRIEEASHYDRVATPWATLMYFDPKIRADSQGWLPTMLHNLTAEEMEKGRDLTPAEAGNATLPAEEAAGQVAALLKDLQSKDWGVRMRAAAGLGKLGPAADAAIPALVKAMTEEEDSAVRVEAGDALASIGPAAIPALTQVLKDEKNTDARCSAAAALGRMGAAAAPAVPELIDALEDPIPDVRAAAAMGLRGIGPAAKEAVPALVKALGEIGPAAREAGPELREALKDKVRGVRDAAARALSQIEVGPSPC